MPKELIPRNFQLVKNVLTYKDADKRRYTLVLFMGNTCGGCKKFYPSFLNLEEEYHDVLDFAMIDVFKFRNVVELAKSTSAPITQVPALILYVGPAPYARYTGTYTMTSVRSFLDTILRKPNESSFTNSTQVQQGRPRAQNRYAVMGAAEDEEDLSKLMCPTNVVPHNAPWDAKYKQMSLDVASEYDS
jgi:thiol-disulfide isomerase/thioredoxin